jgi:hypothetical protein
MADTPWSLEMPVNIVRKVTKTPEVNAPYRAVQYSDLLSFVNNLRAGIW